jgi:NADH-quinone oxidoreductase subunit J
MQDLSPLLFYLFAGLTLLCGLLVVANPLTRNPVNSALFLVLTIVSMAGLFVLLHAFFLAAIQVLVYAGAVVVLFLFVIMFLNLKEEERRPVRWMMLGAGVLAAGSVACLLLGVMSGVSAHPLQGAAPVEGDTLPLARVLYTKFLLPFEITSVLLLVAVIGVVLLSKKETKA